MNLGWIFKRAVLFCKDLVTYDKQHTLLDRDFVFCMGRSKGSAVL